MVFMINDYETLTQTFIIIGDTFPIVFLSLSIKYILSSIVDQFLYLISDYEFVVFVTTQQMSLLNQEYLDLLLYVMGLDI